MRGLEYRLLETARSDFAFLRSVGIEPCVIDRLLPLPFPGRPCLRLTDADARWLKACGIAWEPEPGFPLPLDFCQDQESVRGDYPFEKVLMKKECGSCHGTGKCQLCKGTGHFGYPGVAPVEMYPGGECTTCQGSGDCRACRGTGQR
jgi:hypothetical protein